MVAHESGESDRDKALRIKEERHSKVESSEEEELGSSGAAASAAPSGKEEERKGTEEEKEPLPATSAADPAASTTPAVEKTAETTSAVERTAETKEEGPEIGRIVRSGKGARAAPSGLRLRNHGIGTADPTVV